MKKYLVEYVAKYLEYQQVKIERIKLVENFLPLEIPSQKWLFISMDFVTDLPTIRYHHDSIFVVVEKLTKFAHFIASNTSEDVIVIA